MDNTFGRPEDKDIQKEFMKRIRGDKLQTINAECQLEICLAFKEDNRPSRNKRKNRQNDSAEETAVKDSEIAALIIGDLGADRREYLAHQFRTLKEAWTFEQIEEDKPLPDYFFDDGCDLSYILYHLQQKEKEMIGRFKAEELIFLELLCLEGRKHLTQNILGYYKDNMAYMVEAMAVGLTKIDQKLVERKKMSAKKRTSNEQLASSVNEMDNQMLEENPEVSVQPKKDKKKTKHIQKQAKKGKGRRKAKDSVDQSEMDGQEGASDQNQYPDDKQLALKTCNYISWAYWYIIDKN